MVYFFYFLQKTKNEKTNSTIMKLKAFLKGFFKGLNPLNWTEKDIAPFIVLFLLGFFFQNIKDFVLSLFN